MKYTITALKIQNRHPERVNVFLDGDFAFGVAKMVAAWLQVGQEISEEKIIELKDRDRNEVALQKALNFLDYRPRSVWEIRKKLSDKGFDETVIGNTIDRLQNSGLVGDEQFARIWVENRVAFRPRSHRALAMELRQKGIADYIIDDVLSDTVDDDVLGYEVAVKQARKYSTYEWPEFKSRLTGYLGRRGFNYSTIQPLVKRVWFEMNENLTDINYQDKEDEDGKFIQQ